MNRQEAKLGSSNDSVSVGRSGPMNAYFLSVWRPGLGPHADISIRRFEDSSDVVTHGDYVAYDFAMEQRDHLEAYMKPHGVYVVTRAGGSPDESHVGVYCGRAGSTPVVAAGVSRREIVDAFRPEIEKAAEESERRAAYEATVAEAAARAAAQREADAAWRAKADAATAARVAAQAAVKAEKERKLRRLPRDMAAAHPAVRAAALILADTDETTKAAAERAWKAVPAELRRGITKAAAVHALADLAPRIRTVRGARARFRDDARYPTLAERIESRTRTAVWSAAKRVVQYGAAGGTRSSVRFVERIEDAGYVSANERVFNLYKGPYRHGIRDTHAIAVPRTWLARVMHVGNGTGVVGDALVLDVEPIHETQDRSRRIMRARVVRRSRGFGVRISDEILSVWPGIATLHRHVSSALREHPPESLGRAERERAAARLQAEADERFARDAVALASVA